MQRKEMDLAIQPVNHRRPVKTALHQAVLDCRIHQVRLLVAKQRDHIDREDRYGRTPLMLACLIDNEDLGKKMVKMFLKNGAYVNLRDKMDRSALSYAVLKGREGLMNMLLQMDSVDVNYPDTDGNSPIFLAALSGNPKIVETMLNVVKSQSMNVNTRNKQGYTPLLLACKYGHYASAYILLTAGEANATLRDNQFHLSATEWVERSRGITATFASSRSRSAPEPLRFRRENTLYGNSLIRSCHHTKVPTHPLGQSLDSTLRLPAIFSGAKEDNNLEAVVNGRDAKRLLLDALDYQVRHPKNSTQVKDGKSRIRFRSANFPSTPKLRAICGKSRSVIPDITYIFKVYSDQCQGHWSPESANERKSPFTLSMPPIERCDSLVAKETTPTLHLASLDTGPLAALNEESTLEAISAM